MLEENLNKNIDTEIEQEGREREERKKETLTSLLLLLLSLDRTDGNWKDNVPETKDEIEKKKRNEEEQEGGRGGFKKKNFGQVTFYLQTMLFSIVKEKNLLLCSCLIVTVDGSFLFFAFD